MRSTLNSNAEREAMKAQELSAFGGLNLSHISKQVRLLLSTIGKNSIFDQYTRHDESHINLMLNSLDWIVPETTKSLMSEADWLMIVLAVYFHDLGMVVTTAEFDARATSGFPAFCEQVLFAGPGGGDYRAKVNEMDSTVREHFLYQEFVRHNHPARIRAWIAGQADFSTGADSNVVSEITRLLAPLGVQFRRDLGIVCESHHLNDLGDVVKYKVAQPYGNSDAETVNLQYAAVLLRTADLLHITSDRTPSILFRIINPSDPISQQEWAKQMAVKRVKPKWGIDEDGNADESAPRDTVEVHAYFTKEDGFFGLTSYLGYAADQLKKSNEWITATQKLRTARHEFPWRRIDESQIETEGFIKIAFEFTLDQAKILDLLTGHTLYNDTNVVLRELVQNAIDAIRLKSLEDPNADAGRIAIEWNSTSRVLSVQDNGTGMTQEIINNFLLKVGSSRYQDPEFIKANPGFTSISRFGIGVLSTFMISDSVEIISCHPSELLARRLTLRSVHGKYLIRLLEKSNPEARLVGEHGTLFRLRVRPTIDMSDVLKVARQWVVVPGCKVSVRIDDGDVQELGYASAGDALSGFLKSSGVDYTEEIDAHAKSSSRLIRIVEKNAGGVSLAFAVQWDPWFKEWSFLKLNSIVSADSRRLQKDRPLLGTCVEGIRIVNDTPGFDGYPIVALANVRGASAPKTNVARSGLEITPERDAMLRQVYAMYVEHVADELRALVRERNFSPTWASGEASHLVNPLLRGSQADRNSVLDSKLLLSALRSIASVMVEVGGKRIMQSPAELLATEELWTIDCALLSSAELLIKEVTASASLSELVKGLNLSTFTFPDAPVVCSTNLRGELLSSVFEEKEVDRIVVNADQRRVDLRWVKQSQPPRWAVLPSRHDQWVNQLRRSERQRAGLRIEDFPLIPERGISCVVPGDEVAVRAQGTLYLVPNTAVADLARGFVQDFLKTESNQSLFVYVAVMGVIEWSLDRGVAATDVEALRKLLRRFDGLADNLQITKQAEDLFDFDRFSSIVLQSNWKSFDTGAWRRNRSSFELDEWIDGKL